MEKPSIASCGESMAFRMISKAIVAADSGTKLCLMRALSFRSSSSFASKVTDLDRMAWRTW